MSTASRHAPEYREDIRYVYKQGQLHNQLSLKLPLWPPKRLAHCWRTLYSRATFARRHQALGYAPRRRKCPHRDPRTDGLTGTPASPTRDILARYGNMSSATVWFVLREIMNNGLPPATGA